MKFEFTISARTLSLVDTMANKARAQQEGVEKNVRLEKYEELKNAASKALTAANKSLQQDLFDAFLATKNPLVTMCRVGTFDAHNFTVNAKKGIQFTKVETVLDLAAFVAYARSKGVMPVDADQIPKIQSAVKFAAIQTAGEMAIAPDSYVKRLHLTNDEMTAVLNPLSGHIAASRADVKKGIQSAVNAMFGLNDAGKPLFWAASEDVRGLSQLFELNRVTLNIVVPQPESMVNMFFVVLRHIVGGVPYAVMVKESKKDAKNSK